MCMPLFIKKLSAMFQDFFFVNMSDNGMPVSLHIKLLVVYFILLFIFKTTYQKPNLPKKLTDNTKMIPRGAKHYCRAIHEEHATKSKQMYDLIWNVRLAQGPMLNIRSPGQGTTATTTAYFSNLEYPMLATRLGFIWQHCLL